MLHAWCLLLLSIHKRRYIVHQQIGSLLIPSGPRVKTALNACWPDAAGKPFYAMLW